ncbi:DUF427 domain-containing protein [Microbacterium sp. NPDC078428]|uniref:DUF427 domain-containing protein n=1 Tax=Microbacterium limosum TaxID=3079935 RepID=A0AAU0MET1_9MICO|nr:DUF427 domain-containing protein [Microbacterium sp. Y20]WOQ68976.1 DUF427 domain-containing protein [Microbacterium sp. Y20]
MRAVWSDHVIAEAPEEDLVRIEGNWYFPPSSIAEGVLESSDTPYTCAWKGAAQYFSIATPDGRFEDGAWSYPSPYPGSFERVGRDYSGFVAFSPGVEVG